MSVVHSCKVLSLILYLSTYTTPFVHYLLLLTIKDLEALNKAIGDYCKTPVANADSGMGKRIYNLNMERVLNGTSHVLAGFFARNEAEKGAYHNIDELKERYESMLQTSAPHITP